MSSVRNVQVVEQLKSKVRALFQIQGWESVEEDLMNWLAHKRPNFGSDELHTEHLGNPEEYLSSLSLARKGSSFHGKSIEQIAAEIPDNIFIVVELVSVISDIIIWGMQFFGLFFQLVFLFLEKPIQILLNTILDYDGTPHIRQKRKKFLQLNIIELLMYFSWVKILINSILLVGLFIRMPDQPCYLFSAFPTFLKQNVVVLIGWIFADIYFFIHVLAGILLSFNCIASFTLSTIYWLKQLKILTNWVQNSSAVTASMELTKRYTELKIYFFGNFTGTFVVPTIGLYMFSHSVMILSLVKVSDALPVFISVIHVLVRHYGCNRAGVLIILGTSF